VKVLDEERGLDEGGGELVQDLRQAFTIPERCRTVHRRANDEPNGGLSSAGGAEGAEELGHDWTHALIRHRAVLLWTVDKEVGHARHDADVGLGTHRRDGGVEHRQLSAVDHLGAAH